MERKITKIPSTIDLQTHIHIDSKAKRKVAGYARVSTDFEEQQNSYEAQVEYYTSYIKGREDWEFVKVYTDEGISGTSTKHREGFSQMIEDALSGKIDLIITKSVSRFARNTVDSLTTIRKLKTVGVEIYFEKENIYTLDSKGELLVTLMSSLAQEESRSISENVTWGQRRRFAEGKINLPYKRFLGFKKGADGLPEIIPEEAEIVRYIYRSYMTGCTTYAIAKDLTFRKIPTPGGKTQWSSSTIESILTNEKYKGSALLQKKFTVDFLTKKTKVNEGEVPQYYIEESHDAIINPEEFEEVQAEISRRKKLGRKYSGNTIFSAKIVCGDCGSFFGSKVWHSTSKYRRVIWQCNNKFKGEHLCSTPHLYEDEIQLRFITAFAEFFQKKNVVLETCHMLMEELADTSEYDSRIEKLLAELNDISQQIKEHIQKNASEAQNQKEYSIQYSDLEKQYQKKTKAINQEKQLLVEQKNRIETMSSFIRTLESTEETLTYFDDNIWRVVIERVTVFHDGRMIFQFVDGTEVEG